MKKNTIKEIVRIYQQEFVGLPIASKFKFPKNFGCTKKFAVQKMRFWHEKGLDFSPVEDETKEMKNNLFSKILEKRLNHTEILKALPYSGYSMGEYRTLTVHSQKNSKTYTDHNLSWYSGRYAERETYGDIKINLSFSEALRTKVIGGIITTIIPAHAKRRKGAPKKCIVTTWEGEKNHQEKIKKECWVCGDSHGETRTQAIDLYKKARRRDKAVRDAQKKEQTVFEDMKRRFYGLKDSTDAGNCKEGSLTFCKRANLDPEMGYRGDFLLEKAKKLNLESFVKRMIIPKI